MKIIRGALCLIGLIDLIIAIRRFYVAMTLNAAMEIAVEYAKNHKDQTFEEFLKERGI